MKLYIFTGTGTRAYLSEPAQRDGVDAWQAALSRKAIQSSMEGL